MFGIGVQELIIVPIILALFAVLVYGIVITILSIIRPSLLSQKTVSWAFAYAVAWGGLTMLLPFLVSAAYPSLKVAIATCFLGAITVALGFAVRRRSQAAAWGLVAFALLDIFVRISRGTTDFFMPVILLVLAFPAAIYLRRESLVFTRETLRGGGAQSPLTTPEAVRYQASWPAWMAAGGAFVQVGLTVLVLLQAAEEGRLRTGIEGMNIYSLLDVVVLSAFAIAVLKGHLWGAYALIGYGLLDYAVKIVQRGDAWAPYFVIYLIAAWFLRKKPHVAPTLKMLRWRSIIKYAVVWFVGFEAVAFIFGLLGLTQGGVAGSTAAGVAQLLILVVWGLTLFGFQAWHTPTWSFETTLITSIAAFPLNFLDALFLPITPPVLLFKLLGTGAIAMLGVGCASVLPKRPALASENEATGPNVKQEVS